MVGLLCVSLVIFELTTILQCVPLSKNWTSSRTHPGFCANRTALIYANAAINIVYDLLVLALPISNLWKLDVPPIKKACILAVFLVGGVVTVCSIVRMVYLDKYGNAHYPNVTWTYNYIGLWSMIEVYLSIIWCCMPASAGLVHRGALKLLRRRGRDQDSMADSDNDNPDMTNEMIMTRAGDGRTLQATARVSGTGVPAGDLESGKKVSSSDDEEDGGVPYVPGESQKNVNDPEKRVARQSTLSQATSIDGLHERSSSSPPKVQEQEQARAATARQIAEQIFTAPALVQDPTNRRASDYKESIDEHPSWRPTSKGGEQLTMKPDRAIMPSRHAHSYIAYHERPRYSEDNGAIASSSRTHDEERRVEAMSALQYAFHRNAAANAKVSDSPISRGRSRGVSNERPRPADSGEHPLRSNGVTAAFQETDQPREDSVPVPETAMLQKEDSQGSNSSGVHDSAYGSNSSGNNSKRASPLDGSGQTGPTPGIETSGKSPESVTEGAAQTVMMVRPDPPRLVEGSTSADAEQLLRAQGGFGASDQDRASGDEGDDAKSGERKSLERRVTTGSLRGSIHSHVSACFDSIPTTPRAADLAPEEAMHREDMKEFSLWRPFQLEPGDFAAREPASPNMVKAPELPKAKKPLYYFDEYGIQRPHPSQQAELQKQSASSPEHRLSSPGTATPYEGPTTSDGWKQAAETSATSAALDGAGKITSFIDRMPAPALLDISPEQAAFHDEATTPDERGLNRRKSSDTQSRQKVSDDKMGSHSERKNGPSTPVRQQARMSSEEVWMKPREDERRQSRQEDPLVSQEWSKPYEEEEKWSPVEVSRSTTRHDDRVPTLKDVRGSNFSLDESNLSSTDYTTADELMSTPEGDEQDYRRRRSDRSADQASPQFTFSAGPRPATAEGDRSLGLASMTSLSSARQYNQNDMSAPWLMYDQAPASDTAPEMDSPRSLSNQHQRGPPSHMFPMSSTSIDAAHQGESPHIGASRIFNPPPPIFRTDSGASRGSTGQPYYNKPSQTSAGMDSDFSLASGNSQGSEEDYYRRRAAAMQKLRAIVNDHDDSTRRNRTLPGSSSESVDKSAKRRSLTHRYGSVGSNRPTSTSSQADTTTTDSSSMPSQPPPPEPFPLLNPNESPASTLHIPPALSSSHEEAPDFSLRRDSLPHRPPRPPFEEPVFRPSSDVPAPEGPGKGFFDRGENDGRWDAQVEGRGTEGRQLRMPWRTPSPPVFE